MKEEIKFSANITGDFDGLMKQFLDIDPTLYVEAVDGRVIPVCRLVREPDCPPELFEAVIKEMLK